jgi:aminoglycoside phosphotransferase (APT) family kinase protein
MRKGIRKELETRRERAHQHGALAREVHAALVSEIDRVTWPEASFVHDDFWPGNTVWYRGRVTGVIDWTHAEVGDPRTDVSQCSLDLAMILDFGAAEAFREAYQEMAPRRLPDLWYFDLLRGLRALLSYEHWLPGYHDAGLAHVTKRRARSRIESFLRRARAERRSPSARAGRRAKRLQ